MVLIIYILDIFFIAKNCKFFIFCYYNAFKYRNNLYENDLGHFSCLRRLEIR